MLERVGVSPVLHTGYTLPLKGEGIVRMIYNRLIGMFSKILLLACLANGIASKGLRGPSYSPPIYNQTWTDTYIVPMKPIKPIKPLQYSMSNYTEMGYTTEGLHKSTSLRYE